MARSVTQTRDKPALRQVSGPFETPSDAMPSLQHSTARRSWLLTGVTLIFALLAMPLAAVHLTRFSRSVAPLTQPAGRHLQKLSPSPAPLPNQQASKASPKATPPAATPNSPAAGKPSNTSTRAFSGSGMSTQKLRYRDPIVFNARDKHTGTIIMLHGLGDSGDGWAPIGAEWAPDLKHVKFIFPHAPQRPITVNFGMNMPGWYDIASLEDINQREDKNGLLESQRYVESLVEQEVAAGIPSNRVVVAGFSQGGAVALMMLRSKHKLAGIVGLSTYLPLRKEAPIVSEANKKTPIFMAHGDADYTVQYKYGVDSYNLLKESGADITFKTYNGMAHSAVPQEIADVGAFLKKVLPPN